LAPIPLPEIDTSPSGKLSIEINENVRGPLKRKFTDLAKEPLENEVLAAFAAHAALIQSNRRKVEEERQLWAAREARLKRETEFESREKRRMQFIDAIYGVLEEKLKLTRILSQLDELKGKQTPSLDELINWLRFRIRRIEALLNPTLLGVSLRYAQIEFVENPEVDNASRFRDYSYFSTPVQLQLWSLDYENELARSISTLQ
jgi:hypothetical protein